MQAHRQRRRRRRKMFIDFGRERSTTRIGGHQLHLHESPTKKTEGTRKKTEGRGETRERENEEEERERETATGIWGRAEVMGRSELLVLRLWPWQLPHHWWREPISARRVQILHPAFAPQGACTQRRVTLSPEKRVPGCEGSATQL